MKLNPIDKVLAFFNPVGGIKRAQARNILAYYEAARPDRTRKNRRETGSGNDAVLRAGSTLRQTARHLEQNYDLALGVLNTLVVNTVGANGIGIESQPRNADGTINVELAKQLMELWKDFCRKPEVTKQHDWASMCRMMARSWYRDGEMFSQMVSGNIASLNHGTRVPFSVEMLEADYVPLDYQATAPAVISQGIELNAWGEPLAYYVYKQDPQERTSLFAGSDRKRIPAARMLHIKNVHRIRQLRGVSVFASVLNRFDDLKDYEESERIAAKIAASMAAFIRKGSPDLYTPNEAADSQNPEGARSMKMRPGMIFDDLRPGEEIGMIDTNRPNPNLETYRSGQLKAIAAGAGPTFSSIARTYDGTYSAQRQELVEGYMIYGALSSEFIGRIVRPIYEQFVAVALASGQLQVPAGVKPETIDDAAYMAPAMPWIDPKKEAEAWATMEDRCYISGPEIIRKRGGNPRDTVEQQSNWLKSKQEANVPPAGGALPAPANPEEEEAAAALLNARAALGDAETAWMNARTKREEQAAAAAMDLASAQVKLSEEDLRLKVAQRQESEARTAAALASEARDKADAESIAAQARLDLEARAAANELATTESQARLAALQEQAEQARVEAKKRDDSFAEAQQRARELHEAALAVERKRDQIAAIDVKAAELALRELEAGE